MKTIFCTLLLALVATCGYADEGKYQFVFLYNTQNAQTVKMQEVFTQAMKEVPERAEGTVLAKSEAHDLIKKYSLQRAPMPFVLVLAPNGAVMGGFPTSFTKHQLLNSFAHPVVEKCLSALQNHKLVLLSVQNDRSPQREVAMQGVQDLHADPRYSNATEIVVLDPNDKEGMKFLDKIRVSYDSNEALTVFLAPPAEVVGSFKGPTTKTQLISTIEEACSGCCPGGCCSGGCCPGGKCGG